AAGQIARDGIFKANGTVMIVDGVGDFVGFALGARVQAADDALKLSELANHFRGKVAFGEFSGPVGLRNVRLVHAQVEPLLGEPARDGADAFDLVAITAQ